MTIRKNLWVTHGETPVSLIESIHDPDSLRKQCKLDDRRILDGLEWDRIIRNSKF